MKHEKKIFAALLWIATAAVFGAAYTWVGSEWGESDVAGVPGWSGNESRILAQQVAEQRDLIEALESERSMRIAALEQVTSEAAALRRENEELRAALDALREASGSSGADEDASAGPSTRLDAPLAWLHGLSPERYGDMTPDELRYLRELDLSELSITDADLAHLAQLTSLKRLTLRKTPITDAGLEHLARITGLEDVSLRETDITDAGMEHLARIPTLTRLDLNTTPITDAGLARLADMTQLVFLRLNYTAITEEGLTHLARMTALKRLDLWGTDIGTDPGTLGDLPALEHLELGATDVSAEWVRSFQDAHPEATVRSRHDR